MEGLCLPSKYLIINEIKEVSFKMNTGFIPVSYFYVDTKRTLTWTAHYAHNLKKIFVICSGKMSVHSLPRIFYLVSLLYVNVLFGFLLYPVNNRDQYYIINLLVLLAKYHIYKSKFSNHKPSFLIFEKELKQYITTIQHSINRKAIKTTELCTLYN